MEDHRCRRISLLFPLFYICLCLSSSLDSPISFFSRVCRWMLCFSFGAPVLALLETGFLWSQDKANLSGKMRRPALWLTTKGVPKFPDLLWGFPFSSAVEVRIGWWIIFQSCFVCQTLSPVWSVDVRFSYTALVFQQWKAPYLTQDGFERFDSARREMFCFPLVGVSWKFLVARVILVDPGLWNCLCSHVYRAGFEKFLPTKYFFFGPFIFKNQRK